ncbi:MAG TPA: ABC transporter substrate-binding protein [Actinomycetota bacterium]|nr:ABC transporter substrate-binding protein [Actinomycetota bacterium]
MNKKHRLFALLFAMMLVLAACASNEVEPQDDEGDADTEVSGSVDVAAVWTGTEQENFQAVLDAFTEETGIEAAYKSTGDDVGAYLGTQIEGGNPPDVAMLPQAGLLRDLAGEGSLTPANEDVQAAMQENFAEDWLELGSVDGALYGVYFKAANKSTWWYNTAVFDQAGVQPPATWDEMLQAAQTVNASGVPFVSIGGGDGWTLTDWFENIYIQVAGPEKYDQLANHEIPWTDPSVIEALEVFAQLVGDEANIAGGTAGALQTDFPTSVQQVFSDPPEAATVYEGDFVAGVITGETKAKAGDYDFFNFPQVGGAGAAVVGGGDAAVALTDNEAAQELLAYLATPEAAEIWASAGGFTSANQNVDVSVYPDELTARSAEAVASAETFRFDLSDLQPAEFGGTVGKGLFLRFQDFIQSPDDPEAAAAALEKDAAKAF